MNPLLELHEHGQSYWLDNLTRGKIASGELERRVREEGLRGVTSNPAIFQKAITGGEEYDEEIERRVRAGASVSELYDALVVSDIRDACDVLRPVYDDSDGTDGFVSLEVSPYLAYDTQASLDEARRLFQAVDRPNVFIKIPGTAPGVPAIEEALFEGININITLLFSIESYEAVARAYTRALERRLEAGLAVDDVASVASFFLSRIDVLVDRLLGHRIRPETTGADEERPERHMGLAGIANAKLAYARFEELIGSPRWERLAAEGARVQRMLWASTSTKNPLYSDVRYVEPLIGPHTVNTLPDRTIAAFADHGRVATTVRDDLAEARRVMERLEAMGIDFDQVTAQLEAEGVQKFIDPFDELVATLAERRARILGGCLANQSVSAGDLASKVSGTLDGLDERQLGRRAFAKDPALWAGDPEAESPLRWGLDGEEADAIRNRLGWLESPLIFRERVGELRRFAREVRDEGFERVVLAGMGGSSLAAETVMRTFGPADGWPELVVLDDTDPDAVEAVRRGGAPETTLHLVASKSGTTAETMSFYRRLWEDARNALGREPGDRFVAITDPGTPLAQEGRERGFRRVFENPEDIGGRYSALSWFGLVPMALLGVDVERVLDRALAMRDSCAPIVPAGRNPALHLGAVLGRAGRAGRTAVTFLLSESAAAFGDWVEQLLAESTGKEGRGLLPVIGDPLVPGAVPSGPEGAAGNGAAAPETSRSGAATSGETLRAGPSWDDRIFVRIRVAGNPEGETAGFLDAREAEGHPVVRIELDDETELGAEFFRWELATAVAGALLGIDPFDEPNVAESKRNTRELLAGWEERGGFDLPEPTARASGAAAYLAEGTGFDPEGTAGEPGDLIGAFLDSAEEHDYVALLAWFRATPERSRALAGFRAAAAARSGRPTTVGHGPRYLHSTGQLHKGGPDSGLFLFLTADPGAEVGIPGEAHGFGTLQRAQALGDVRALADRGRRVLRVHLEGEPAEALQRLHRALRRRPASTPAGS